MDRKTFVKNNITQYGQSITIRVPSQNDTTIQTKAFIQPLRHTGRTYQWDNYLDSGLVDLSNYIYIGPYDVRLDNFPNDTILEAKEKKYVVRKANTVCIGDDIIYVWAVLRTYEEEPLK